VKDSFCEELELVLDQFQRDFNTEVDREDIFKITIGNENLHESSNNNGVIVVNYVASKYLTVKSTMFPS
jgi:hypothetical protein